MRRVLLATALGVLSSSAGGCTIAGYCCGRLTDFDETTRSDRRKVREEEREKKEEALEEAADEFLDEAEELREESLDRYYAWIVKELGLPEIWAANRAKPELVRAWRLTTLDGVYGDGGGFAGVRLLAIPDWSWLVTAGLKAKFEREFPKRDRDRLARDLWMGERWAIRHLDAGVPGIDVEISVESGEMPEGFSPVKHVVGTARTDLEGRGDLAIPRDGVPGSALPGAYELVARIAGASPPRPVERDEAGHLFVRRGTPRPVLLVDAEELLDWTREVSRRAMLEGRWIARDWCVRDALPEIAKSHPVVAFSSQPDALAAAFREGLVASGAAPKHPRSVALHFAAARSPLESDAARIEQAVALAARYRGALGEGAVAGLVTPDPSVADAFARRTGAKAWTLAAPKDGGWCAGLPALLPPRTR